MDEITIIILFITLFILIVLSGFFSGSETALMSLNKYKLRHLAQKGHQGAIFTQKLLERPDRLLGLILLGNNFVNILATSIATVLALQLIGEAGIAVATTLMTLVVLIFSEVTPKTFAALHPERLAFIAAYIYTFLLKIFYPLVWLVNAMANTVLRLYGIVTTKTSHSITKEELRSVLSEAHHLSLKTGHNMFLGVLDLDTITVEDIMIPRNQITGINLEEQDWESIAQQIIASPYTRLPVYRGTIENIVGIVHIRRLIKLIAKDSFDKKSLESVIQDPYFIPENTPLHKQLVNFQKLKKRIAMVVNEYGDIQGLVTLEDILEEIVGDFTTDPADKLKRIKQEDGSYIVNGNAHIRELNQQLEINLPTEGPKTLNGLILEQLENIPDKDTTINLSGYSIEILETEDNVVRKVKIKMADNG